MNNRLKTLSPAAFMTVLGTVLAVAAVGAFFIGRFPVPAKELFAVLGSKLFDITPFWNASVETVVINIRLPRILLACLVGGSLSMAGAAYQGVFQNPLASPDILGASAGAAFGAALAILLGAGSTAIVLSAFFFSLFSMAAVWLIARRSRGRQVLTLILAGIVVSSLFSASTSFVKLVADPTDQLPAMTYWLMGSLAGAKLETLGLAFIPMAVGFIPLYALRWKINVLTMGDDEARTLGVNAAKVRLVIVLASTFLTAASVAVSGVIGWVGLVVPHLARRLVGDSFAVLIPASFLLGGIFLLIVDTLARSLLLTEIPIGILTAFIGAPFFLYLITKRGNMP